MRHIITAAGAALLLLLLAFVPLLSTPCPTEDSTYCFWDSQTRGNRAGHSFIALSEGLQLPLPMKGR